MHAPYSYTIRTRTVKQRRLKLTVSPTKHVANTALSLGHMRLHSPPASSRRDVLTATPNLLLAAASLLASGPLPEPALAATVKPELAIAAAAQSVSQPVTAAALLQLIPAMPFGATATNETLPASQVSQIEAAALSLEGAFRARNVVSDRNLNGSWRLLYSDGREISSLAAGFPGGFQLGPTYQPIDLATGRFENQGSVVNAFGLARLSTCVVGDV
jgi:hypothetical protein